MCVHTWPAALSLRASPNDIWTYGSKGKWLITSKKWEQGKNTFKAPWLDLSSTIYHTQTHSLLLPCKICPLSTATCGCFTGNVQQIQWIQMNSSSGSRDDQVNNECSEEWRHPRMYQLFRYLRGKQQFLAERWCPAVEMIAIKTHLLFPDAKCNKGFSLYRTEHKRENVSFYHFTEQKYLREQQENLILLFWSTVCPRNRQQGNKRKMFVE